MFALDSTPTMANNVLLFMGCAFPDLWRACPFGLGTKSEQPVKLTYPSRFKPGKREEQCDDRSGFFTLFIVFKINRLGLGRAAQPTGSFFFSTNP